MNGFLVGLALLLLAPNVVSRKFYGQHPFSSILHKHRDSGPTTSLMIMENKSFEMRVPFDHECKHATPLNETKYTQELLEWFLMQLKSFIEDDHLDTFRFEVMEKRLADDLTCIATHSARIILKNSVLSHHLRVCSKMFESMVFATKVLTLYDNIAKAENYLVNRIVDLNIRFLLLVDLHGFLDTGVVGHVEKLHEYSDSLEFLKKSFAGLKSISNDTTQLFDNQVARAEAMVRNLWAQIPGGRP
ncbi:hypothetical protein JCM33374_g4882 [Metschnikowia sp. JCM 33374]|nr:hypothetical protein JCM33374_g4882 [Metschnikowia sp. JCM 33374]